MKKDEYSIAYAEVLHYLKGIRKKQIMLIPKGLIEYFKANKSQTYKCNFDYNKPLEKIEENEKIYQKELNEKYSYDNIFKKSNKDNELENEEELLDLEPTKKVKLFEKIINKLKQYFNKNNIK